MPKLGKYPALGSTPPRVPHCAEDSLIVGQNHCMRWWNCAGCNHRVMDHSFFRNEVIYYAVPPCPRSPDFDAKGKTKGKPVNLTAETPPLHRADPRWSGTPQPRMGHHAGGAAAASSRPCGRTSPESAASQPHRRGPSDSDQEEEEELDENDPVFRARRILYETQASPMEADWGTSESGPEQLPTTETMQADSETILGLMNDLARVLEMRRADEKKQGGAP